jgi:hypothetical protein
MAAGAIDPVLPGELGRGLCWCRFEAVEEDQNQGDTQDRATR